jgi:hypothetical protein
MQNFLWSLNFWNFATEFIYGFCIILKVEWISIIELVVVMENPFFFVGFEPKFKKLGELEA